ncbi:hypothetical protein ACFOY2_53605 [Nonomuraea purpurea]|uniref:Isochorismatase family protein n=1 Tax=Nonomuraea purpurea TaxID=1849276 RepID=A0ABV8GTQ8_9ACTN
MARAVELADAFHHHGAPVVLVRLTARADGSDAAPGRTEIPRPPGPLPAGWDAIADRDAESHRHSMERIFPLLGERGCTAEIIGLLTKTRA